MAKNLDMAKLLPANLVSDNPVLTGLLENTFQQFTNAEDSVQLNGWVGRVSDAEAEITPSDADHRFNIFTPALYSKTGVDESLFLYRDFLNALGNMGVDETSLNAWLRSQASILQFPIDYDKFVNYHYYVWVGGQTLANKVASAPSWNVSNVPEYVVIKPTAFGVGNDWQKFNYWIHVDDLAQYGLSISEDGLATAQCPIIEFDATLEMNGFFNNSKPSLSGTAYTQSKTTINQYPLFNLYEFDGTFTGKVSSIFFYQQDPAGSYSSTLNSFPQIDLAGDYVFGTGLIGSSGEFLYYKNDSKLENFWAASVSSVTTTQVPGHVMLHNVSEFAETQEWTGIANGTLVTVSGSRSGIIGTVPVGTSLDVRDFKIEVTAAKDFSFFVHNTAAPRFVQNVNGIATNAVPEDETDTLCWLAPEQFYANFEQESRTEFTAPTLFDHFRRVMLVQEGFSGTTTHKNNARTLKFNRGLGGKIKSYGPYFPLLVSIVSARVSPITLLNFLEQQYAAALQSVEAFFVDSFKSLVVSRTDFADMQTVLDAYETYRAKDIQAKSNFANSTAPIAYWPATTAVLGITKKVQPREPFYDEDMEAFVVGHHDGHLSPIMEYDAVTASKLVDEVVHLGSGAIPAILRPANTVILNDDDGNMWVMGSTWERVSHPYWAVRNSLIVEIENRLYSGTYADQTSAIDVSAAAVSEDEYTEFLLKYKLTDYVSASYDAKDPFTWNYKQSTAAVPAMKARWSDLYVEYFYAHTGLKFARPDLEPWKLLGYKDKTEAGNHFRPAWFSGTFFDWEREYGLGYDVDAVLENSDLSFATVYFDPNLTSAIPTYGYPNVDGYNLADSDVVITEGGVYQIVGGKWMQVALANPTLFKVSSGFEYADTFWLVRPIGGNYYEIEQVRQWDPKMWRDIKSARPGLKLCVNVNTDTLIPPYVSSLVSYAYHEALITNMTDIVAPSAAFTFGDGSKQELFWRKSLEYVHAAARESFRANPLKFVSEYWGYEQISVAGSTPISRLTKELFSKGEFLIHGESLKTRFPSTNDTVPAGTWICRSSKQSLFVNTSSGATLVLSTNGVPFLIGDTVVSSSHGTSWTPASIFTAEGMIQTMKNYLRYSSIDEYASEIVNRYRNWEYKLAYRFDGLIRSDTFNMVTEDDGTYPTTAYEIMLAKHEKVNRVFYTALRVQLVRIGTAVLNASGKLIPLSDGADWEFRIEGYNPAHPYITVTEWNKTAADNYQTFYALGSEHTSQEWKHYTIPTGTKKVHLPITIVGIQNVIDLLTGYSYELFKEGFTYDTDYIEQDANTGRTLNWQLEIEKFVDNVYTGVDAGSAYVCNPSVNRLALKHANGIMSAYEDLSFYDLTNSQAVFDVLGAVIPTKYLYVDRRDARSITISQIPMFSANVFTDRYEHILVLNSQFLDDDSSAVVFDSFLNKYITSAHLSYVRQRNVHGKPSYAGFFLSGSELKRNITASVDNISTYYDTTLTFDDKTTANHALTLLGHTNEDLFKDLTLDTTAKFNFWRGMIQSKGTSVAIEAYASISGIDKAVTDEYWAYKIAEYGDAREKSFPEIKIGMNDVSAFTKIQFFNASDSNFTVKSDYLQIEASDSSRWFELSDLGKGLVFETSEVTEAFSLANMSPSTEAPVYVKISNKFLNSNITLKGCTGSLVRTNILKITAKTTDICSVTGRIWLTTSAQSPIKLIDYADSIVTTNIGEWHPAAGKHDFNGMSIVHIAQDDDPAQYNFSLRTADNANYNKYKPWAKREVGRVWFNTKNLEYVPYWDKAVYTSINSRAANWGRRADWSSINVYEWTESSVHPSEYNALAATQEGDSTIDNSVKAQGTVAFADTYARDRIVSMRPIAWSHAGSGSSSVYDAFGSITSADAIVSLGDNSLIIDNYRLADAGITEGKHFGAWQQSYNSSGIPLSEAVVGANVFYDIGAKSTIGESTHTVTIGSQSVTVKFMEVPGGNLGAFIGEFTLTKLIGNADAVMVRMTDVNGEFDDVEIQYLEDVIDSPYTVRTAEFTKFGVKLQYSLVSVLNTSSVVSGDLIASAIANLDIMIREGVNITTLVAYNGTSVLANDIVTPVYTNGSISEYTHSNPAYQNNDGWRCWVVPAQSELDADSAAPYSAWTPILGTLSTVGITTELIKLMKADDLVLNTGITIKRFSYDWTEWMRVDDTVLRTISNGQSIISFTLPEVIDASRLVLYIDGRMINTTNYEIFETTVTLNLNVVEGSEVVAIYKKYTPSTTELAFDPDVLDDKNFQKQYKISYDYTHVTTRDVNGNVTGSSYYFWVKDKTIPKNSTSISLSEATALLGQGSSQWFSYEGYLEASKTFDSCVISGLNSLVKKNDAFKIRFSRDFTLREDPNEIELRNVHTEWTLISPLDTDKIPKSLWTAVTNCVSEVNEQGISIPSKIRIEYDKQNGTSTQYGMGDGQIFADPALVRSGLTNTLLNTSLTVWVGGKYVTDTVRDLDYDNPDLWFADAATARSTMDLIWKNGSVQLINELFFSILELAFMNNFTFAEIFKTSMFTVQISSDIEQKETKEPENGIF